MIVFTAPPPGDTDGRTFMKDLYKQYSRLMYATALRSVPNREDCEDIVQDAVESLCRKVHTLMGLPGPALTVYIVHTVKSKVGNFQRHQSFFCLRPNKFPKGIFNGLEPALGNCRRFDEGSPDAGAGDLHRDFRNQGRREL